jgi:sterol desaturase/sphingolipid hydroxylase (fatty acid hydroxylase superfamily)
MGTIWLTSLGVGIVVFVADYLSSVFTAQSKYYFKGAQVFIRLIIVHLITEGLLLSWALLQMPYNGYSMQQTYQSMYDMFMVRLFSSSILGIIAMMVIWILQTYIEKIICLDVKPDWNLFKISIDESRTVLLDIDTWNKASKQTKADFIDYYDHRSFKKADL